MSIRHNQFGDTLIEVLMALAVIALVLGGAYVAAARSLQVGRDAQERTEALKLTEGQLERLKWLIGGDTIPDSTNPFSDNELFCMKGSDSATIAVEQFIPANNSPKTLEADNFNNYPAGCRNGLYYSSVYFNENSPATDSDDVYEAFTRWDRLGGGRNEVHLVYRI